MGQSSRNAGYSFRYSVDVIEKFLDYHWRVTEILRKKTKVNTQALKMYLVDIFMHDQVRWRAVKETFKHVGSNEMLAEMKRWSGPEIIEYITYIKLVEKKNITESKKRYDESIDRQLYLDDAFRAG